MKVIVDKISHKYDGGIITNIKNPVTQKEWINISKDSVELKEKLEHITKGDELDIELNEKGYIVSMKQLTPQTPQIEKRNEYRTPEQMMRSTAFECAINATSGTPASMTDIEELAKRWYELIKNGW